MSCLTQATETQARDLSRALFLFQCIHPFSAKSAKMPIMPIMHEELQFFSRSADES